MTDLEKRLLDQADTSKRWANNPENWGAPWGVHVLLLEAADTLAAVREWAEKSAAGYDASTLNSKGTYRAGCGLHVLAILDRTDTG